MSSLLVFERDKLHLLCSVHKVFMFLIYLIFANLMCTFFVQMQYPKLWFTLELKANLLFLTSQGIVAILNFVPFIIGLLLPRFFELGSHEIKENKKEYIF